MSLFSTLELQVAGPCVGARESTIGNTGTYQLQSLVRISLQQGPVGSS